MSEDVRGEPSDLVSSAVAVLRRRPSAFLTDIDGTISPMAPTPDSAIVDPGAKAELERISQHVDVTGVVTGRALDVAGALVGLPQLAYIGNHGLERRINGEPWDHPVAVASRDQLRATIREIGTAVDELGLQSGIILEDKRLSGTVHYRQAPDTDRVARELGPRVHEIAKRNGLRVTAGRMIWELRPSALVTKGTAVDDLIARFGLKGVIFIGDDTTDVDAFNAIGDRCATGEIAGLRVGVVGPETPEAVREASDFAVPDVASVVHLLADIADGLERAG